MIHFTLFKFKDFEVSLLMPFRGFSNKMDWGRGACINPICNDFLTKGLLEKRKEVHTCRPCSMNYFRNGKASFSVERLSSLIVFYGYYELDGETASIKGGGNTRES